MKTGMVLALAATVWFLGMPVPVQAGTNPPATMSNSYKLIVPTDGLYTLTYAELQSAGLPVDTIDPHTFKVWLDGTEVAIEVVGEADGHFNSNDYILFYGQAADTRYVGPNVYWLTYGGANGLRMTTQSVTPNGSSVPVSFLRTLHLEENHEYSSSNPMTENADHWYWDKFRAPCYNPYNCKDTKTYQFDLVNLATGSYNATLRPRLRGSSSFSSDPDHHVQFWLNGHFLGDAYWDGTGEFTGTFSFDQSFLIASTNTISYYVPLDLGTSEDSGFTNWIELDYHDVYTVESDVLDFSFDTTGNWQPTLSGFSSNDLRLLDITDPTHPVRLTDASITANGPSYDATFAVTIGNPDARFFAAAAPAYLSVASITLDTPSDLRNTSNSADWIAITHADFMAATLQLAAHRQNFSGYRTAVVDVQDIYDEFNGGKMDPEAIRQFVAYAYHNWQQPAPHYLLLVGDGSYDYRNYQGYPDKIYIPPYMDVVDCFFGEVPADNRYVAGERTNSDPSVPECQKWALPFMAVGRFPVNNTAEAQTMVYRTICYENPADAICGSLNPPAGWDHRAIFVSDDNDGAGAFTDHGDEVAGQRRYTDADFGYKTMSPRPNAAPSRLEAFSRDHHPAAIRNIATTTRPGAIGDFVWNDANGNSRQDAGENGISGVKMNLWLDQNNNGILDSQDASIATATTGADGSYLFDNLGRYSYIVEVDSSNFNAGGALAGMAVTTGADRELVDLRGYLPRGISADKLYYRDTDSSSSTVKSKLKDAIDQGALFVNYNGHASTWKWGGEDFFDTSDVSDLHNSDSWPIFLPMTCLEGQFSTPGYPSVGEAVVRTKDSNGNPIGGVASWSPAGFGVATGHTTLSTNFYKALFQEGVQTVGNATLFAKQALFDSSSLFKDLVESYNLFGDPALVAAVPRPDLRVSKQVTPGGTLTGGEWVTYTMEVDNHGVLLASNVVISDPLPSLLENASWTASNANLLVRSGSNYIWDLLSLDVGENAWITVTAQVSPALTSPAVITNVVTVSSRLTDANGNDNTAQVVSQSSNTGHLSGVAWEDANANGIIDPTESVRLSDVSIQVVDTNQATVASLTTNSSGYYEVDLPGGQYTVTAGAKLNYVHTTPTNVGATVTDGQDTTANFGYISPSAVEIAVFAAKPAGQQATLRWRTLSEEGICGYYVARSRVAVSKPQPVSSLVPVQGGETVYSYRDRPPVGGNWYYWLLPVEADGSVAQAIGPRRVKLSLDGTRQIFLPLFCFYH